MQAMATYTYKNISNQDIVLPNVGMVEAGKTIESDVPIDNPNLQQVTSSKGKK